MRRISGHARRSVRSASEIGIIFFSKAVLLRVQARAVQLQSFLGYDHEEDPHALFLSFRPSV